MLQPSDSPPRRAAAADRPARVPVLVVDPVQVLRDGLAHVLSGSAGIDEVVTAADVRTTVLAVRDAPPPGPVTVVNVAGAGGVALVEELHVAEPTLRLIVVGAPEAPAAAVGLVELGVLGVVPGSACLAELVALIVAVAGGTTLFSPEVGAALMRRVAELSGQPHRGGGPVLTVREDQILGLLEAGMSNDEIARALGIETRTVKNHVHNVLAKLGVHRRAEAVAMVRHHPRARAQTTLASSPR